MISSSVIERIYKFNVGIPRVTAATQRLKNAGCGIFLILLALQNATLYLLLAIVRPYFLSKIFPYKFLNQKLLIK